MELHLGLHPGIRIEIRAPDRNLLPIRVGRPGSAGSDRNEPWDGFVRKKCIPIPALAVRRPDRDPRDTRPWGYDFCGTFDWIVSESYPYPWGRGLGSTPRGRG